jgi:hypothetical protein
VPPLSSVLPCAVDRRERLKCRFQFSLRTAFALIAICAVSGYAGHRGWLVLYALTDVENSVEVDSGVIASIELNGGGYLLKSRDVPIDCLLQYLSHKTGKTVVLGSPQRTDRPISLHITGRNWQEVLNKVAEELGTSVRYELAIDRFVLLPN